MIREDRWIVSEDGECHCGAGLPVDRVATCSDKCAREWVRRNPGTLRELETASARICRNCVHWSLAPAHAPWAGRPDFGGPLTQEQMERDQVRAMDALDEHICRRFGGFSSSGGFGPNSQFDEKSGRRLPMIAYMLVPPGGYRADLVTTGDFGCPQFSPTR